MVTISLENLLFVIDMTRQKSQNMHSKNFQGTWLWANSKLRRKYFPWWKSDYKAPKVWYSEHLFCAILWDFFFILNFIIFFSQLLLGNFYQINVHLSIISSNFLFDAYPEEDWPVLQENCFRLLLFRRMECFSILKFKHLHRHGHYFEDELKEEVFFLYFPFLIITLSSRNFTRMNQMIESRDYHSVMINPKHVVCSWSKAHINFSISRTALIDLIYGLSVHLRSKIKLLGTWIVHHNVFFFLKKLL